MFPTKFSLLKSTRTRNTPKVQGDAQQPTNDRTRFTQGRGMPTMERSILAPPHTRREGRGSSMVQQYGLSGNYLMDWVVRNDNPETFLKTTIDLFGGQNSETIRGMLAKEPMVLEAVKTREGRDTVAGMVFEMATMSPRDLKNLRQDHLSAILGRPFVHGNRNDMNQLQHAAKQLQVRVLEQAAGKLSDKAEQMGAAVLRTKAELEDVQLEFKNLQEVSETLLEQAATLNLAGSDLSDPQKLKPEQRALYQNFMENLADAVAQFNLEPALMNNPVQALETVTQEIAGRLEGLEQEFDGLSNKLSQQTEKQNVLTKQAEHHAGQAEQRERMESDSSKFTLSGLDFSGPGAEKLDAVAGSMKVVKQYHNFLKVRQTLQREIKSALDENGFQKPGAEHAVNFGAQVAPSGTAAKFGLAVNLAARTEADGSIALQKGFTFDFGVSTGGPDQGAKAEATIPITLYAAKKFKSTEELATFLTDKVINNFPAKNWLDNHLLGIRPDNADIRAQRKKVPDKKVATAMQDLKASLGLTNAGRKTPEALRPTKEIGGSIGLQLKGLIKLGKAVEATASATGKMGGKRTWTRVHLERGLPATPKEARAPLKLDKNRAYHIPGQPLKNGSESRKELATLHKTITGLVERNDQNRLGDHRAQLLKMSRDIGHLWNEYTEQVLESDKGEHGHPDAKKRKKELEKEAGVSFKPTARYAMRSDRARMRRELYHTMAVLTTLYQATLGPETPPEEQAGLQVMRSRLNLLKFPEYALEKNSPKTLTTTTSNYGTVTSGTVKGEFSVKFKDLVEARASFQRTDRTVWNDPNPDNEGKFKTYTFELKAGADPGTLSEFLRANEIGVQELNGLDFTDGVTVTIETKQDRAILAPYQLQNIQIAGLGGDGNAPAQEILGTNTTSLAFSRFHHHLRERTVTDHAPAHAKFDAFMNEHQASFETMMENMVNNLDQETPKTGAAYEMDTLIGHDQHLNEVHNRKDTKTYQLLDQIRTDLQQSPRPWAQLKANFIALAEHQTEIQYTGDTTPSRTI